MALPADCVFCQLIADRTLAQVVGATAQSLAITPLNPVVPGHFIVMPLQHEANAYTDPEVTARTMADAAGLGRAMSFHNPDFRSANIITSIGEAATQTVQHLHIHVVPRRKGDGLALPWTEKL